MVTDSRYPNEPREFYCLSTDDKPTESFNGLPIPNGSSIVEVDTGYVYLYNAASAAWVKV